MIEADEVITSNLDKALDLPEDILKDIMLRVMENGIAIGRWVLDEDSNNDFIIKDLERQGYYRFPKTSQRRVVVAS